MEPSHEEYHEIVQNAKQSNKFIGVCLYLYYVSPLAYWLNKPAHDLAIEITKELWNDC